MGERFLIDEEICNAALQIMEKAPPGLGRPCSEGRKAIIAELGGELVPVGVPPAGVVHGDPRRRLKARLQDVPVFGGQGFEALAEEAHDLTFGDIEAHPVQERGQPFAGHLALKMRGGDELAKRGTKAADDPGRQVGDNPLALRRFPPFASIKGRSCRDPKILNRHILIPLEA